MENNENYQAENQPVEQPVQQPAEQPAAQVAEQAKQVADQAKQVATEVAGKAKNVFSDVVAKLKALPKIVFIAAAAAIVVLIAGIVIFGAVTNTYKTPINEAISYMNAKKATAKIDGLPDLLNGFLESEADNVLKTFKKTELYKDNKDDLIQELEDLIDDTEDVYGKNYKYSYKVEEKEKLEKEDLKDFRDQLKDLKDELGKALEETEDWDSDDWEDMAEELGVSKTDAKNLVKSLEKVHKALKSIKVTNGYELSIVQYLNGSELDEAEETELEIRVYKVNGRWVSMDTLGMALAPMIQVAMGAIMG